jgi:hypothetical protein
MSVRTILHRDHLGLSLWRHDHLLGGVCLLRHGRGRRPDCYPRYHVGLEWRGRLWSRFWGGPAAPQ